MSITTEKDPSGDPLYIVYDNEGGKHTFDEEANAIAYIASLPKATIPPVTTFVVSFYAGTDKAYADNPRGMGPRWQVSPQSALYDEYLKARAAKAKRFVSHRNDGVFKADVGNSWEVEGYRFMDHRGLEALGMIGYNCRRDNITFGVTCGLRVGIDPLDMALASHRAALVRTCKFYAGLGVSELWVDTGGSIRNTHYGTTTDSPNTEGMGVDIAAYIALDHGIALVPEWTRHLPDDLKVPAYCRIRRTEFLPGTTTRAPMKILTPKYGGPVIHCTGFNVGGMETEAELATLPGGPYSELAAYNPTARAWAVARVNPAPDTQETK